MPTEHHELAYAKLTRFLHVTGQRPDGYHLLDSEMILLDLADELTIRNGNDLVIDDAIDWSSGTSVVPATGRNFDPYVAHSALPTGPSNLVNKALALVGRTASVHLVKHIPAGAGLGGGSADAAAILRWAGSDDLDAAARLGADVPFCIRGGRARVGGIGEVLTALPEEAITVVLVTPALAVASAAVYAAFDELGESHGPSVSNHLEPAAIAVEPRLARWRDFLREIGERTPVLAGSGSSYFFECGEHEAQQIESAVRKSIDEVHARAQVRLCRSVPAGSI